jgi:PIN domain nuclease of toxin-antitoxin system
VKVLFDTQALVFWIAGLSLPRKVEALMKEDAAVYVSVLAPWELLIKRQFRGIGFTMNHFWRAMDGIGANLLSLEGSHVDAYAKLPFHEDHRDPFDRMLIAQAISEGLTLVSNDQRFRAYDVPVMWN